MNGLSPELRHQLSSLLIQMEQLKDTNELSALFITDARLALWNSQLPDLSGLSLKQRTNRLIAFLLSQKDEQGQHGLVLFLQVLSEELSPQDAHRQQLVDLAQKIEDWHIQETDEQEQQPVDSTSKIEEEHIQKTEKQEGSSPATISSQIILSLLREHFDLEELRELCFILGVKYDDLRSEGRKSKARELVMYLDRCGRLPELTREMKKQRPNIPWPGPGEPEPPIAKQVVAFEHFNIILQMKPTSWSLKLQNNGRQKLKRISLSLHPPPTLWLTPHQLTVGNLDEQATSKEFTLSAISRLSDIAEKLEIEATYLVNEQGQVRSRQACQLFT